MSRDFEAAAVLGTVMAEAPLAMLRLVSEASSSRGIWRNFSGAIPW